MKLKVKRLIKEAVLPKKAHDDDVGFDLVATSEQMIESSDHGFIEYGTGISVTPPQGYYVEIVPRSSISKTGLWLANSVGTIDPGYVGELKVRFKWIPRTAKYIVGDKIAQIIMRQKIDVEIEEVQELEETTRGAAGFGSSGK